MSESNISDLERYSLNRPKKGLLLIINNLSKDKNKMIKKWSREETEFLQMKFKENLGFDAEIKLETPGEQKILGFLEFLKGNPNKNYKPSQKIDFSQYNIFTLVVLSHGVIGDEIIFEDKNNFYLPINKFGKSLNENSALTGTPKLLFFHCCRGSEDLTGKLMSNTITKIYVPSMADIFYGLSTTEEFKAKPFGFPFTRILAEKLSMFARTESFQTIFTCVQGEIAKIYFEDHQAGKIEMQVPESRSTLTKQLHFF